MNNTQKLDNALKTPVRFVDPNAVYAALHPGGFRPIWIEDADGARLFTVSERSDETLARRIAAALNATAHVPVDVLEALAAANA